MTGPRDLARMKTVLALALFGAMIGYLEPAYCEGQRFIDRGTLSQATAPTWVPTGNLNTPRNSHTATLLTNGKVLVVGGRDNDNHTLDSAELYDPATGTWSVTGALNMARISHTATLLQSGKVLVAGGGVPPGLPNTAEVYDPASGTWSVTGSLAAAHAGHAATLLPNGNVLIVGGRNDFSMLNNAELYDPIAGTWGPAGNPTSSRIWHTATLLQSGNVLVFGGIVSPYDADIEFPAASAAELYDPVAGSWRNVGSPISLYAHTATLLPNGKVLMAGGFGVLATCAGCLAVTSIGAELYDPAGEAWSHTGTLSVHRVVHTASLSPNGKVLVAGGAFEGAGDEAELYDPDSGLWTGTSSLNVGRWAHTATLLLNGDVLVAGGTDASDALTGTPNAFGGAELYEGVAPPPGTIGAGFTGAWYDPAQSGHGLFVEVLSNNRFYATWFAFNPLERSKPGSPVSAPTTATPRPLPPSTTDRWTLDSEFRSQSDRAQSLGHADVHVY